MKKTYILVLFLSLFMTAALWAQDKDDINPADIASGAIFDDKALLEGYTQKYADETRETLLAMINDDSLGSYKCTAAVRVMKKRIY